MTTGCKYFNQQLIYQPFVLPTISSFILHTLSHFSAKMQLPPKAARALQENKREIVFEPIDGPRESDDPRKWTPLEVPDRTLLQHGNVTQGLSSAAC